MSATLEQKIIDRMKDAMRNKDRRTSTLMRMIKSKVTERTTNKDYNGETGDALWQGVVEAYVKASQKVLIEYLKLGEQGAEHADQVQWEIDALREYMPQLADEAQTRVWVKEAIASLGDASPVVVGRVMGEVMKSHKGQVDPGLTKKIAQEELE